MVVIPKRLRFFSNCSKSIFLVVVSHDVSFDTFFSLGVEVKHSTFVYHSWLVASVEGGGQRRREHRVCVGGVLFVAHPRIG